MTVEILPSGMKCNLGCSYCYQDYIRDADNESGVYNFDKMIEALERVDQPFTLFGGEPLLTPISELEKFLQYGHAKHGHNSIQTNGTLITDRHIQLFKRYNCSVGISFDGPGRLNDARKLWSLEATRAATEKTRVAIITLISQDIIPSLIVTLNAHNIGDRDRLRELLDWFDSLGKMGVYYINTHLLERDKSPEDVILSPEWEALALKEIYLWSKQYPKITFSLFDDMKKALRQEDGKQCIWNACDPLTTSAVYGIDQEGHVHNCGRTNKDGVDYLKADQTGKERQLALYYTPYEYGGCKGCRFFLACKGECPGSAISGDWRNRTEHCSTLISLFEIFEKEVENPISLNLKREQLESEYLENPSINGEGHDDSPHIDWHHDNGVFKGQANVGRP